MRAYRHSRIVVLLIALFCCFASVEARSQGKKPDAPPPSPADKPKTANSENKKADPAADEADRQARLLRARAFEVLLQVARDASEWDKKELAVKIQTRAADLLWEIDAGNARGILMKAWEAAGKIEEPKRERSAYRNYSKGTEYRRDVLLVAKRHDEKLAQKWIEEMAQEQKAGNDDNRKGAFDDRTQRSTVLLQMALASVKDNPKAAADFAIESLTDGISFGLQDVLIALQQQSFDLAVNVFRAALNRLRAGGMSDPSELLILYSYLYTPGRISAANTTDTHGVITLATAKSPSVITPAAQYNPALAAEFLNVAADLLINAPAPATTPDPQLSARTLVSAIEPMLGAIRQVSEEKASLLVARLQSLVADAQFSSTLPPPPDGYIEPRQGEKSNEYNARRVDNLEELAERESSTLRRDIAFAKAAAATEAREYERGWRIASRVSDDNLRLELTNWLTYRAALYFLDKGDLDKAYTLNNKNNDLAQRAVCLIVGAQKLAAGKDNLRASEWLREASGLMKKSTADGTWAKISLGIVACYGKFDSIAALTALGESVRLMNQSPPESVTAEAAPSLQHFTGITPETVHVPSGFSLDSALAAFKPQEFESVYGVLRDLQGREVRGAAVVTLCTQFLRAYPAAHSL